MRDISGVTNCHWSNYMYFKSYTTKFISLFYFVYYSFEDSSSISSGDISDTINDISTDEISTGSSLTGHSSERSNPYGSLKRAPPSSLQVGISCLYWLWLVLVVNAWFVLVVTGFNRVMVRSIHMGPCSLATVMRKASFMAALYGTSPSLVQVGISSFHWLWLLLVLSLSDQ